jgi:2',3'-cyclic-nucleotide 2'-phosphodiesterase (5'-nucleotidase family)/predicted AlkP superfamily phosphohydrolase/phosphomutase
MKRWARWLAPAFVGAAAFVLTMTAGTAVAKQDGRPVDRVVMFASDGMRPDLMERYAKAGFMPTYKNLMKDGVTGQNGMVQAFPPNTGVGWYTMATGTYPSEHGSTNNTFFRAGDAFSNRTAFSAAGVLQADTIANAAERAGKKVAQIDWVGGAAANIAGPTVDFTNFFSNRGVLVGAADPVEQAGSAFFGVTYQVSAAPVTAAGWTGVPAGDPAAPPKETTWSIPSTFAAQNPARTYNVYFYDSVTGGGANYDHAIVSPVGKTGAPPSIDLKVGDFLPIKLTAANGLIGARAGQTVGHYVKLISLAPNLSNFKLYDTSLARAIAKCGAPCNGLPAGGAGEDRLEKYIADNLLPWAAADFAPEEAGVIDEDTYVQQGRDLERAYSLQVINFILGTLQPDTDLAMVGYPFTDEVSHQFMGLVSPTEPDGSPNPCYDVNPKFDDVQCTGRGTAHRVEAREGYIRSAYEDADEKLGITRELMGGNPATFAGSDHGFAPQAYAVNANQVLNSATVGGVSLHASGGGASNCSAVGGAPVAPPTAPNPSDDITKACWAGGTIQIYVNPNRLRNAAQPTSATFPTYEEVRTAVRNAFQSLTDPAHPGDQVVSAILNKEDLRNVDGSDSLHPNRSGDVVVVLRPPYQSDAGTAGQKIALSHFFGQHGYLPDYVDLKNNINMHAVFVLGGPGVKHKQGIAGLRAIDVAPTLSFLMDIPGPQNARGRILYDVVKGAEGTREITILDISDWHAQLTPLAEASDTLGPSFGIAGAAFLKRWFDIYEAESALSGGSVIEVAGGDSFGGATPPISNFFGDKPTPPIMGMMGIDVDVLGNHSFDHGQTYLRTELIPLAPFPMLSANVVFPDGTTPPEWSKSTVLDLGHGVKLGVVGFTTESTPGIVFPGNLDPFEVRPVVPAVNAEAAALAKGTDAILALGHEGASSGTVDNPSGPLIDIADNVTNVDAVIGDHNDVQVDSLRANGVLVTENRGKGIRFTRMRLVIGPGNDGVVYKTADFHKPWNIGLTPDPAIQAKINELNAQLAPILGTQIGSSTKFIPRADQCGRADGRLCESFVGNVVTDAMRTRYSSIGVQFAITNSGGLRDALTCPTTDLAGDFCPAYSPPPFPITRGQSLAVLPFGNIVVTLDVNGSELKTMLENGVSLSVDPATLGNSGQGRFPQVSGLCFTYNIAAPSGNRVTSAVVANADGSCTATPVDLTAGTTYKIAENDFMATGGDGYPNFASRMTTQDIMEQVAADYITASSPLSPAVRAFPDGRINCADSNGAALPNCPTLVPSP